MEHWRKKAIEIFPEQIRKFSTKDLTFSVYELFYRDMLGMWESAAKSIDVDLAGRILSLVEWALADADYYDVRNSANVSFLEHIPDKESRLYFAEHAMPEHLYSKAIKLSAYLHKSDPVWQPYLEASLGRYNDLHSATLSIRNILHDIDH